MIGFVDDNVKAGVLLLFLDKHNYNIQGLVFSEIKFIYI